MSRYTYYPNDDQLAMLVKHVWKEDSSCPPHDNILTKVREKLTVIQGRISSDCKRLVAGRFGADPRPDLAAAGTYHRGLADAPYAAPVFLQLLEVGGAPFFQVGPAHRGRRGHDGRVHPSCHEGLTLDPREELGLSQ